MRNGFLLALASALLVLGAAGTVSARSLDDRCASVGGGSGTIPLGGQAVLQCEAKESVPGTERGVPRNSTLMHLRCPPGHGLRILPGREVPWGYHRANTGSAFDTASLVIAHALQSIDWDYWSAWTSWLYWDFSPAENKLGISINRDQYGADVLQGRIINVWPTEAVDAVRVWAACEPYAGATRAAAASRGEPREPTTGTDGADALRGRPGTDLLRGAPGADTLHGGPGPDAVLGGRGADTVRGGVGTDVVDGGPGEDAVHGGPGDDQLDSGLGDDQLRGGPGDDVLRSGRGEDDVDGGPGDDTVADDGGRDTIRLGPGNDAGNLRDGRRDRISCGPGDDAVVVDPRDRVADDCDHAYPGATPPVPPVLGG